VYPRLSPYLHFGHISSRDVVKQVTASSIGERYREDVATFVEEIVVRKELSDNYCYYSPSYRNLSGAPAWAAASLTKHLSDPRLNLYTLDRLENADTHDLAWNAAQRQMMSTGSMHGYMRMYWAKKVMEWSSDPHTALHHLCYLNDRYSLDGGDPNGYAGIMWAVCGVHDRPWGERPIYGTIRSMVYDGLRRKFNIKAYENQWLK
jgi:deoxyribodipyrimidine photo-lyase